MLLRGQSLKCCIFYKQNCYTLLIPLGKSSFHLPLHTGKVRGQGQLQNSAARAGLDWVSCVRILHKNKSSWLLVDIQNLNPAHPVKAQCLTLSTTWLFHPAWVLFKTFGQVIYNLLTQRLSGEKKISARRENNALQSHGHNRSALSIFRRFFFFITNMLYLYTNSFAGCSFPFAGLPTNATLGN